MLWSRRRCWTSRTSTPSEEIELINEQISLYNNLLEEKSAELEDAQAAESEQYDLYCKRVRAMEENGSYTYLDMIFNCGSIGELLSAMDDISEIMKADQRLFEQYKTARENTEKVLGEYEDTLSGLNDKQSELETRRAELERKIEEATALIADLDEDIEQAQQEYLANEAAEQALNDQMNQIAWEMWQQEQAQKEEENNNNNTGRQRQHRRKLRHRRRFRLGGHGHLHLALPVQHLQ